MRNTVQLREVTASIRKNVGGVILLSHIEDEYEAFLVGEESSVVLKMFLRKVVKEFLSAIDLNFLHESTAELLQNITEGTAEITNGCMIDSDDANTDQIRIVMNHIHERINTLQIMRETCSDFFTVLEQAEDYLRSFKRVMTQFICNKDLLRKELVHDTDRNRILERTLIDVDSYIQILKSDSKLVAAIMKDYISARSSNLMRADSAVRLICNERQSEYGSNRKQSANKVTDDTTTDDVFNVTNIGS